MATLVHAVGRRDLPPYSMPDRFRHDIAYFISIEASPDDPTIAPDEYRVRLEDAARWLDDGTFRVVSPLDSTTQTEVELTEEQQGWLEWLVSEGIDRIRLE